MIIDTHAHYEDAAFDEDREQLIAELHKENIIAVNVGATVDSALTAYNFSQQYDNMYCSIGVHPDEVGEMSDEILQKFLDLSSNEKVVSIGEIGLDYHWMICPKEEQKKWFEKQIELARMANLPINIHSRDAAADTFEILKRTGAGERGAILHCYGYSVELAREYLKLGFYFGIGGIVTFKNSRVIKEVVRELPVERMVLETDCPFLAPTPNRGKRNDSRNLIYVARAIAEIKGITEEEVIEATCRNARTVYPKIR